MKLTKFRIYNYKSIIDSGYCTLAADLTILIGKNESGKSSILEALRDLDKNVNEFSPDVYPLDGRISVLQSFHAEISFCLSPDMPVQCP